MKKKSMITALVLSVAMLGIGTGSAFAGSPYEVGTGYVGYANGNQNTQMVVTDGDPDDPDINTGTWSGNDTVTVNGTGQLNINGYTSSVVNGILNATGGTVNLTGGALTLGTGSSVADGVTLATASGTTLILDGGSAVIGGGYDNIAGNINAITGNLTVNGNGINIGTDSSVANAVNLNVSGTLGLNGGTIHIGSGDSVTGTIAATSGNLRFHDTSALDNHYDVSGTTNIYNNGTLTISQNINTTGRLSNDANSTITNTSTSTVGTLTNNGTINGTGSLTTTNGTNNGSITQGTFEVANDGNYNNNGSMNITTLNVGTGATLNNSGVTDATTGDMVNASIVAQTIANNGEITLNNADLSVTGNENLGGIVSAVGGESNLAVARDFTGTLNVGKNDVTGAILNVTQNNILPEANVHIYKDNTLNLGDETTSVTAILGNGDTWDGDLNNHSNSVISIVDGKDFGTVGYSQDGTGVLNVTEGAAIRVKDASKIEDGTINVASDATFASAANGFNVKNMNTAGTIGAMNDARETYNATNTVIGTAPGQTAGDSQADFTIDILARGNHRNETDHFNGGNISAANGEGTINISDWDLNGDIYGWDAPIDRNIDLTNVFTGTVTDNSTINYTATDKEVFTPIGWYKLNANPNKAGSYTLDMTRFNPWVFRGQVTKLAQYQNQLAIDDMLFTHSMVLPSFKENDRGYNASILSNRYAAGSPLYAPYEYSRKDGGVWFKMYGNFEHLNMNRGLNVENNSYGALIGADLGLRELRGGWTFMPTAYIGYNGAHQNYARQGAWQNGGQAGFLGTWYKDNFIIGALVYGGVYNNEMDTPRGNDDAFNYFAGGSVKTAYNWRFHRDWVLQPNFLVAYNFFGKENWHSDFGQMGMMSGQLHGVNVAPGLNLIWEKETFSAYATLQYMYNVNQAVGGRAGNVGLPHVHMDRGYIQYGLGFNKRFGDRFSGYLQAVFRNVGRTGVGFQGGFNFALGKKPSNYNATLKGHTPSMQKAKLKMNSSHS